jgi:hypothetical protein
VLFRSPASIAANGVTTLVWEDDRNGTTDVYAQGVRPDGKLGAAAVPGDAGALAVRKSAITTGDLTLSWGASCSTGASNYAIYEGTLGSFASHVAKDCFDDGGNLSEETTPRAGSAYYLVVAQTGTDEGSYGKTSAGAERPRPATPDRCLADQNLTACTP